MRKSSTRVETRDRVMFFRSSARMILNRSSGAALSDDAEVSQIGRIVGRIAAIAALVISPVATAGAAGAGAPEARDLCLEGERRMEAGDLTRALESFRAARETLARERPLKEEVAD